MATKGGVNSECPRPMFRQAAEKNRLSEMARLLLSLEQELSLMELKMEAQENQIALPLRSHTILGACEAIGEDFGFNPVLLRIPLAATVLWSPLWAIVAYFVLAGIVLASRLVFPKRNAVDDVAVSQQPTPANEQRTLAEAA
jgi:phage shock protein C